MNRHIRNNIAKAANIILKEFDITIPITDMDDVITRLNGRIEYVTNYLEDGYVYRSNESDVDFIINLSNNLSVERRNFAIAQQFGTLILHMGYLSDWDTWEHTKSSPYIPNAIEKAFEAHQFASHFLMPKQDFLDYINDNAIDGIIDVHKLSAHFGVTDIVAINHGKWIGGLRW